MSDIRTNVLIEAAGLTGVLAGGALYQGNKRSQRARLDNYVRFELRFPAGLEAEPVAHVLADLLAPLRRRPGLVPYDVVIFEIIANRNQIQHFIEVPPERVEYARSALEAALPGVRIEPVSRVVGEVPPRSAVELALTNPQVPLRADAAAAISRSILAALQPLRESETLKVTWALASAEPGRGSGRWEQTLAGRQVPTAEATTSQLDPDRRKKLAAPQVGAIGRIAAWTEDLPRGRQLQGRVLAAMQSLGVPGARLVKRGLSDEAAVRRMHRRDLPAVEFPAVFSTREMVALLAWPLESPVLPGLQLIRGRVLPPADSLLWHGRPLGVATYPGRERPIFVGYDSVARHSWIVGPSGSGKSWLLVRQVLADIKQGQRAVILIDFKSDSVDDVLARYPQARDDDLLILDVTASPKVLGLNPLEGRGNRELVAAQVFAALKRRWNLEGAPRSADLLDVAIATLARHPGGTLTDLAPLLTNAAFRNRVTAPLRDDLILGAYWSAFAALSEGERAQVIAPLLTRIRQVLLRSDLRVTLGQPRSAVDFADVMATGKVLLVPASAGLIGPDAAASLTALVFAGIWSAAQRRGAIPPERRRPVSVFVDEFQVAVAGVADMSEMMAMARGYNLALTLANQYPTQLSPDLRDAVVTNSGTKVIFATSATNALSIAREFEGLTAEDIQGLDRYHAIVQVALGQAAAPPVTLRTEELPPAHRDPAELRRAVANRFGRSRDEIEAEIRSRQLGDVPDIGQPGVRRRQP